MPFPAKHSVPISTQDIASWIFDNATYDLHKPIYIDAFNPDTNFITASQARQTIRKLIAGFHVLPAWDHSEGAHNCVAIHSFNSIYYPVCFQGIVAAGGVFTGTSPAYTEHELAHCLKIAKVKYVLVHPAFLDVAVRACGRVGLAEDRVIVFNADGEAAPKGFMQWRGLLDEGERDWRRFDGLEEATTTTAALLFTSGTTGLPKVATISHYNLIASHTLVFESQARSRTWSTRRLLAMPMFHVGTAPIAHLSPLREGSVAVVMPRFDLDKWLWAGQKFEITDVMLVPPIALAAVNSSTRGRDAFRSTRVANCGAAPMSRSLQKRVQSAIGPQSAFTQVWGMTETTGVFLMFPFSESDDSGAVGYPLPCNDVKLVNGRGADITAFDVQGELCVRGPTVARGYFGDAEATRRAWDKDGYLHTGDIARCASSSGKWYIVDREKELIKVRANQVAPSEIEGVLLSHPSILDAAVVGVADVRAGEEGFEVPRAYVVVKKKADSASPASGSGGGDEAADKQAIHAWMKDRLASFKQLLGGIAFVDAIPKNASGKILRKVLVEQARRPSAKL